MTPESQSVVIYANGDNIAVQLFEGPHEMRSPDVGMATLEIGHLVVE